MKKNDLLAPDIDFEYLALVTKNYTGAEIEAVCRSATSYALFKDIDLTNLSVKEDDKGAKAKKAIKGKQQSILNQPRKVTMADFEKALKEIKPAFGVDNSGLENSIRGGIVHFGDRFN